MCTAMPAIRQLSSSLQKKSENELNEVPNRIEDDLRHIREWIAQQPHLTVRTDDQWLLSFLRGCKFSLERTKEKLDMYYTMRTILPEFYSNRDPFLPEIQQILQLGLFLPFSNAIDSDEPRIILIRCGPAEPTKINFINVVKVGIMIIDILMNEDDNYIIAGQEGFGDLKGLTIYHAVQVTPSLCKKLAICLQNSYPTRPKKLIFTNVPSIAEKLFQFTKPFLTEKIRNRVHVYSKDNLDHLYQSVPQTVLPKEYGGKGESLEELTVYWKKKVESYKEWFLEDEKYRSNEKLRPGRSYTSDELFGVEGSFRKLIID